MAPLSTRGDPARHPRAAEGGTPMTRFDDHLAAELLDQRIVFLGTQVDEVSANRVCAQLLLLSAKDPRTDISLCINSPGGLVTACTGLAHVLMGDASEVEGRPLAAVDLLDGPVVVVQRPHPHPPAARQPLQLVADADAPRRNRAGDDRAVPLHHERAVDG